MVICLERGADLHIAQLMPLPLTVSCSRIGFTIWYRLTRVVLDKGPLNRCVCVCEFLSTYQSDKTAGSYYCAVVSFLLLYFFSVPFSTVFLSSFLSFSHLLLFFFYSPFFFFFRSLPFSPFCLLPLSVYSVKEVGEVDVACYWLVKLEYFEC